MIHNSFLGPIEPVVCLGCVSVCYCVSSAQCLRVFTFFSCSWVMTHASFSLLTSKNRWSPPNQKLSRWRSLQPEALVQNLRNHKQFLPNLKLWNLQRKQQQPLKDEVTLKKTQNKSSCCLVGLPETCLAEATTKNSLFLSTSCSLEVTPCECDLKPAVFVVPGESRLEEPVVVPVATITTSAKTEDASTKGTKILRFPLV